MASHTAQHPPHLQHHFDTPEQQFDSSKLGMWVFLATEVLLFAGLFCAYAVYRANHPEIFVYAHEFLDRTLGGINTVVLLCSSFTMAWAVRAAQLGRRKALVILLSLTFLGGLGFMGIKYVEYKHKWEHGLLWGTQYRSQEAHGHAEGDIEAAGPTSTEAAAPPPGTPSPPPDRGAERSLIPPAAAGPPGTVPRGEDPAPSRHGDGAPSNVQIFFGIYFLMTGLHGLHVLVGMGAIGWLVTRAARDHFSPAYFTPVDLVGLYWHLVDLIWLFLFPLLYLIH